MTTSQHSPDATDNSNVAASGSAAATGDAKQISLNVRTLDHTTYPINICSDASVPQLKELVAEETGVVFARQRLIFRGKVLKNDQNISAYALEDGHTLHLVTRTEAAVAASAAANATTSTDSSSGENATTSAAVSAANTAAAAPRNNDEPDPTIGTSTSMPTNHVLMGATITVPEGSDVNMPFLSSMIANIMNSVHGSMAGGNIIISEAGDPHAAAANGNPAVGTRERGAASTAHFVRPGAASASANAGGRLRARRSRAEPSLRSLGGGSSSSRSRSSSSSAAGGSLNHGLTTLRSRSETLMDTIRSNMESADFDFAGLENVELDAASGSDTAFLQSQLTQLGILLDHFRTRAQLLPAALEARATSAVASSSQPRPSVGAIVRTVDTLQTIGELADLLARMARFIFIRHNSGAAGAGASIRVRDRTSVAATGATAGPATATESSSTSRRSGGERRQNSSSSTRERHATTTGAQGDTDVQGADDGERARGNALFSLLERMNESIRGATAGWTGRTENASSSESEANAPTSLEQSSTANTTTAAVQQPEGGVHRLPQISIAGLGAPMASVVFPISFADLNANTTTTWNFAELVSRLSGELPASTLFGIVSGDPVSIHQVMAQIGYAIVSGVDVPPVSRATIRTWSHTLVIEVRQQLRSHGIPASILSEIVEPQRQTGFVDQLLRPLEPFIPDLVDHFLRATSASRTAAFGSSSVDFLQTMSRQFVRHLQTYLSGNGADEDAAVDRLVRVLRNLLMYLGLDARLAAFAVDNFVEWASGNNRRRQRPLEADGAESGPANKRQREGQS